MPIVLRGPPKATRGKCERGHGSVNADGAGAEVFAGDGCSQGASFGPMVAISRRGQGGRIYNNTRARVLLRRMCVKSADLTTHSPPKSSAPPPAPRHALPEHFCSPPQPRRTPTQCRRTPAGCAMHARRPHNPFPAEDFLSPPHSDTPSPSTSAPPRSPDARPRTATHARRLRAMHSPPTAHPIPRRRPSPAPHSDTPSPKLSAPPRSDTPSPSTSAPPRSPDARPQAVRCIPRRPHNPFPAAPRCLSFRSASGTKKRHRTVHVRCRMSRSTVVAVGHLGW